MDETDRKILEVLMKNSRTPYKEIAKAVKISDVAVHKRIKKLGDVIDSFTITVKQEEYGRGTVAVILVRSEVGRTAEIAEELAAMADVTEVYNSLGEYDIIAKVRTESMDSLKRMVEKELSRVRGLIEIRTNVVFDCKKEEVNLVF
ncbi:MAG: Lrp/AsnC family transcriptional regulator [Euryarchaeota archaeon]|nr:Lrp/AsnC family transcriptional regulator [Euryarchaeota archaeon]